MDMNGSLNLVNNPLRVPIIFATFILFFILMSFEAMALVDQGIFCGDMVCEGDEDTSNCPEDCMFERVTDEDIVGIMDQWIDFDETSSTGGDGVEGTSIDNVPVLLQDAFASASLKGTNSRVGDITEGGMRCTGGEPFLEEGKLQCNSEGVLEALVQDYEYVPCSCGESGCAPVMGCGEECDKRGGVCHNNICFSTTSKAGKVFKNIGGKIYDAGLHIFKLFGEPEKAITSPYDYYYKRIKGKRFWSKVAAITAPFPVVGYPGSLVIVVQEIEEPTPGSYPRYGLSLLPFVSEPELYGYNEVGCFDKNDCKDELFCKVSSFFSRLLLNGVCCYEVQEVEEGDRGREECSCKEDLSGKYSSLDNSFFRWLKEDEDSNIWRSLLSVADSIVSVRPFKNNIYILTKGELYLYCPLKKIESLNSFVKGWVKDNHQGRDVLTGIGGKGLHLTSNVLCAELSLGLRDSGWGTSVDKLFCSSDLVDWYVVEDPQRPYYFGGSSLGRLSIHILPGGDKLFGIAEAAVKGGGFFKCHEIYFSSVSKGEEWKKIVSCPSLFEQYEPNPKNDVYCCERTNYYWPMEIGCESEGGEVIENGAAEYDKCPKKPDSQNELVCCKAHIYGWRLKKEAGGRLGCPQEGLEGSEKPVDWGNCPGEEGWITAYAFFDPPLAQVRVEPSLAGFYERPGTDFVFNGYRKDKGWQNLGISLNLNNPYYLAPTQDNFDVCDRKLAELGHFVNIG